MQLAVVKMHAFFAMGPSLRQLRNEEQVVSPSSALTKRKRKRNKTKT